MNNNINWGIIGLGNIAQEIAKSLNFTRNAKLFAIASNTKTIIMFPPKIVIAIIKTFSKIKM